MSGFFSAMVALSRRPPVNASSSPLALAGDPIGAAPTTPSTGDPVSAPSSPAVVGATPPVPGPLPGPTPRPTPEPAPEQFPAPAPAAPPAAAAFGPAHLDRSEVAPAENAAAERPAEPMAAEPVPLAPPAPTLAPRAPGAMPRPPWIARLATEPAPPDVAWAPGPSVHPTPPATFASDQRPAEDQQKGFPPIAAPREPPPREARVEVPVPAEQTMPPSPPPRPAGRRLDVHIGEISMAFEAPQPAAPPPIPRVAPAPVRHGAWSGTRAAARTYLRGS